LCAPCHPLGDEDLVETHLGASLEALDCLSCHAPHATTAEGGIRSVEHSPFEERDCGMCHDDSADDPSALLVGPPDLCMMCHEDPLDVPSRVSAHPPVQEGQCLSCHTPHASNDEGLLKGRAKTVCLSCHDAIRQRAETSTSSHLDYAQGDCTACHVPHASGERKLLRAGAIQTCSACHEQHMTFSHPMGGKTLDPRTGQPVDCLSCHDPHGTSHAFFLRADANRDLCVQCHETEH
jgi:predicted CXXCH cytochrome family protein